MYAHNGKRAHTYNAPGIVYAIGIRLIMREEATEHAPPNLDHPVWVQLSDVTYSGPHIVEEGQPFTLHCKLSIFDAARWTLNGRVVEQRPGYVIEERTEKKLTRIVSLHVAAASTADTGGKRHRNCFWIRAIE